MNWEISENTSVAKIVTRYPHTRKFFEGIGIDYCCGGKYSLKNACDKIGLAWQDVIEKLLERLQESESKPAHIIDWTKASLTELAGHIVNRHHSYLREQFPRLTNLADKVFNAHKENHGEMIRKLKEVLENLRADIEMHLEKEEQILFPLIKDMEAFANGQGPMPTVHCGTVENPIRQMEFEHDTAGDFLSRMRSITNDYQLPDDACESFKALYDGLKELEKDLHEHIHLENNILFPKAIELEKNVNL